jgi:hypothetical protein
LTKEASMNFSGGAAREGLVFAAAEPRVQPDSAAGAVHLSLLAVAAGR